MNKVSGGRTVSKTRFGNLAALLRDRAAGESNKIAYTFLVDGEEDARCITYAELDARATGLAARLAERVSPGDRVVLLCPPGLEFIESFFGCLYAGAIAVPAFPPDPRVP